MNDFVGKSFLVHRTMSLYCEIVL